MFKTRSVVLITLFSLLMTLGLSAQALVSPDSNVSIEYEHRVTDTPNSIHIAGFMPGQGRIVMEKAREFSLGRETVSSIAAREHAVLGINASFFEMRGDLAGIPVGMLKIKGAWFGVPRFPRAVLGWKEDGTRVLVDQLDMEWTALVNGREEQLSTVNGARKSTDLVLYTPVFNSSTLTESGGVEVIVKDGRIAEIQSNGNAEIPENGFVLSYGPEAEKTSGSPRIGFPVQVSYRFKPVRAEYAGDPEWKEMDYLVGGAGLLIWNGEPVGDYLVEKLDQQGKAFDTTRHPRTAVGIDEKGKWFFVVVDGRQPGKSIGMSLEELTGLMASLNCKYAINLDGGGSSTMYLNGSVKNNPANRGGMMQRPAPGNQVMGRPGMERPAADGPVVERPVSDALLILE